MVAVNKNLNTTPFTNMPPNPVLEVGKEDSLNKGSIGRIMEVDPYTGLATITVDSKTYRNVAIMQPVTAGPKGFALPAVINHMDLLEDAVFAHIVTVNGMPYINNIIPLHYNKYKENPQAFKDAYKERTGKEYIGNKIFYKFDPSKDSNKLPARFDPVLSESNPKPNEFKDKGTVNKMAKEVRDSYYIATDRDTIEETYRLMVDPNDEKKSSAFLDQLNKATKQSMKIDDFAFDMDCAINKKQLCWFGDSAVYKSQKGSKIMGIDDGRVAMIGGTYCHSTWSKDNVLSEVVALHKYRNLGGQYEWGAKPKLDDFSDQTSTFNLELWSHKNDQSTTYDNVKAIIRFGSALSTQVLNEGQKNEKKIRTIFDLTFYKKASSNKPVVLKKDFMAQFQTITSLQNPDAILKASDTKGFDTTASISLDDSGNISFYASGDVSINAAKNMFLTAKTALVNGKEIKNK